MSFLFATFIIAYIYNIFFSMIKHILYDKI
jgi:hypothetical protein